ncbi:hypothetical protein [Aeromicrobium sp. Root472D3]|uniref:hypothetical protein n=1 Tax=Aeromicrobium sp. Root472D3 TaxID=1736540 RepID=UPI000AA92D25|nr:hypothetical protein [Aeromicrobium sp. Root472D3]
MTEPASASHGSRLLANVLLVVWVAVWPLSALIVTADGVDFSAARPPAPADERHAYLVYGLTVGIGLPLAAGLLARSSYAWRVTSSAMAALGAISFWFSYGLKYGG